MRRARTRTRARARRRKPSTSTSTSTIVETPRRPAIYYELFLRSAAPLDVETAAAMAEAVAQASSSLRIELYVADGATLGIDVAAPLDAPQGGRALCAVCFQLAVAHSLSVFDPQLARVVTEGERELILEHFDRTSAFDTGALPPATTTPSRRLSASTRLWLVVGVGAVVVFVLMRALSCSLG